MNLDKIKNEGRYHADEATRERFSHDSSSYRIVPQIVVDPAGEEDVIEVLAYARGAGLPVTCRSGGSGLSGAGVGPGIVLNFRSFMNRIKHIDSEMVVEPGVVLKDFLKNIEEREMMMPAIPSSSAMSALGGNIGTRATGPRTARYGTIDAFVTSLKFVSAEGVVVDTRENLPEYLEKGIMQLRDGYLSDRKSRELFENRPFIAGGYNVNALSRYRDPREIAAHLLVGSIGTLGIVTEIRFRVLPARPSQMSYIAYFSSIDEIGAAVDSVMPLHPAAVEFADKNTMAHINGQFLSARRNDIAGALLVEFDESEEQARQGREILESFGPQEIIPLLVGSPEENALWDERRRILPSLWKYATETHRLLPSIIDDVAIHRESFADVYRDLSNLMPELGHEIAIYGHVGFGSLHARPFFDPKRDDITKQIENVSINCFHTLRKYGGTLVGEHNSGRSRSMYLEMELGDSFRYFREIKNLFDPDDILNPNTIFDLAPITSNMVLG